MARNSDELLETSRKIAETQLGNDIRLVEYSRTGGSCRAVYASNSALRYTDYEMVVYSERFDSWYATGYTAGKTLDIYGCRTEVQP